MSRMMDICRELWGEKENYYHRWYHSLPLVITAERRDELRRLHSILYRCCEYFALHYKDFVDKYMPLAPKEMELLEYQSTKPFRAGTWRPDWIVAQDGSIKLCEITSRFFGHGIFMSYYAGCERFEEMIGYMLTLPGEKEEIYVLKSSDKTSAIGMYKPFYEHFGKKVTVLEACEVESNREHWQGKCIFSALNQKDLMSYSMDTLKAMVDSGMFSDMRTILLLHDKRFMKMWFEDDFTSCCLSPEDAAFLREHSIMTYSTRDAEAFADALTHKDLYILKPHRLGKSEGVHAGCMTSQEEWNAFFCREDLDDFILQPFIQQRTYSQDWEGQHFDEFICGMMLCVDDKYFDSGMVRTSSAPVTNKVDDRKMRVVHVESGKPTPMGHIL